MRRFFRCFTAASAIAIGLASVGQTVGQFPYNGYDGAAGGFEVRSIRTPSFLITRSPWGATAGHLSYGSRRLLASPYPPYDAFPGLAPHPSYYGFPGADLSHPFAPSSFGFSRHVPEFEHGISSRYTSPQDRYAMTISPYGTASDPAWPSPYSLGAPSERRWSPLDTTRPLPFARSPYDTDSAEGFGVTGTAPARSLSDRELSDALVRAASELDDALAAQQDGDVWQDYLQPMTIAELFRSPSISAADKQSLHRLRVNFEATIGNKELRWVTETDGFAATRQLLKEWFRRRPASDEGGLEIKVTGEMATDYEGEADGGITEVEELPAPAPEQPHGDQPQLNPPQLEQPHADPPRRYEL